MCNKHPKAVVTDGDVAMREAIKHVFPDASHRLCAWHLHNNACENVKNSSFLEDFNTAMYSNFTPNQFEDYWKKMVVKHGLVANKWVCKTYENKSLWGTAFLRENFFGRIRTTSQCEAINAVIKTYVRKKSTIVEFMHKFEQAFREYRNNELIADFKSFYSEPVMTTSLYKIEREASKIYTLEVFKEVKHEIEKAGALIVSERIENGENLMFKLSKYCKPGSEINVVFDILNSNLLCDCRLFESRGIPCSHILCALKNEHVDYIPSSLICKRWTKTAKSDFISSIGSEEIDSDVMKVARFGAVAATSNRLCEIAAENREFFKDIRDDMFKLVNKYENLVGARTTHSSSMKDIGDPTLVKTKGAPRKKKDGKKRRRCSNCNKTGHIVGTCPMLLNSKDQHSKDDSLAPSYSPVSSGELDNDKEGTPHDENIFQPTMIKNQHPAHKEKNVNEKSSQGSKRKGKKVKCSIQNSIKDSKIESFPSSCGGKTEIRQGFQPIPYCNGDMPEIPQGIQPIPSSSQVRPEIPQGVYGFPHYGHGIVSQGLPLFPPYAGVPFYHQNPQVPVYPQFPQYLNGGQNVNNGLSWNGLLQEVIKNGAPSSSKHVQP